MKNKTIKKLTCFVLILCTLLLNVSTSTKAESAWESGVPMSESKFGTMAQKVGDKIYVFGGYNSSTIFDTVEIYDLNSKSWSKGTSMPERRYYGSSVHYGDKIYIYGGRGEDNNLLDTMLIYNTKTNSWENSIKFNFALEKPVMEIVGDYIYIIGGLCNTDYNRDSYSNKVYRYNLKTESLSENGTSMSTGRYQAGSFVYNKRIYILGGNVFSETADRETNVVEAFNTVTNTWETKSSMPESQACQAIGVYGRKAYAIGGWKATNPGADRYGKLCYVYDIISDSWIKQLSLPYNVCSAEAVEVGNSIYIIGGVNQTVLNKFSILTLDEEKPDIISVLLEVDDSVKLIVKNNLPDNALYNWSSSNSSIATVDSNGIVSAIKEGMVTITAECKDSTYKEEISVLVSSSLNTDDEEERLAVYLEQGQSQYLYLNDDYAGIEWTSMDTSVATVSHKGKITAVGKGDGKVNMAIIKAEYADQEYLMYVKVL